MSTNLTPMDFRLCRCLKSRVYAINPQTVSDLKDAIRCVIQQIPFQNVSASVLSAICCMQSVTEVEGGYAKKLWILIKYFALYCTCVLVVFSFLISHSNVDNLHATSTIAMFFCYGYYIPIKKIECCRKYLLGVRWRNIFCSGIPD